MNTVDLKSAAAWLLLAALGALSVPALALEEDWRAAEQVVQETSDAMLVLIEEGRNYAQEDPERFYQAVEGLLTPVVDFRRFAGSVMGKKYYQQASSEQRARFADSFKWGLVRTYGLALTEFQDGELVVIPATKPPPPSRSGQCQSGNPHLRWAGVSGGVFHGAERRRALVDAQPDRQRRQPRSHLSQSVSEHGG